jgi:hypothetical protein
MVDNDLILFLFSEDALFEENNDLQHNQRSKIAILLSLMMKTWLYRLNAFYLSTKYLLQGNVDFFFTHCNSKSLKKVTQLNRTTFELYTQFNLFWQKSFFSYSRTFANKSSHRSSMFKSLFTLFCK